MTLSLLALIAWLGVLPLCFGAMVLLLPRHLHRRATTRLNDEGADVVQLQAVRDRRSRLLRTGTY
jgi:hypothetical protein